MVFKKISLEFNSSWVLSKKDEEVLPIEIFINSVKTFFGVDVEVVGSTLTDCQIVIKSDLVDKAAITTTIDTILKEKLNIGVIADVAQISVSDIDEQDIKPKENETAEDTESGCETEIQESQASVTSAMQEIDALIGAEEFKALAKECQKIAPQIAKHKTHRAFAYQSYLFSINDGYGLSTYLKLFADLLSELDLFSFKTKDRIFEVRLPSPQGAESSVNLFDGVLCHFNQYGQGNGKLICIDISEWMTKTNERIFRDFLSALEDRAGDNIFVFKIPFIEKEILCNLKKSLGDLLFIKDISFVPMDIGELIACAKKSLAEHGFAMADDGWSVFEARLAEEKSDGKFYGINTVNKVVRETIYRKQLENANNGNEDCEIKKEEILAIAETYDNEEICGYDLLNEFVGMEDIKTRVMEIIAQIEMSLKNKKLDSPCIHMRFVGNPGTGKTTVARVLGKILKEKGVLRNGSFFEYHGRDFCGRYVGQTAPKTAGMCRDAYGSVMFIDEAYSLFRGEQSIDYGMEAIDTLIAEMENHRSDFVVIMAGYTDDMEILMRANAGLASRMPYIIEFPNFNRAQLYDIFISMAGKSFTFNDEFKQTVKHYFDTIAEEIVSSKEFSNARFVRNLFERTWGKATLRGQFDKDEKMVLLKEDFLMASSDRDIQRNMKKGNRPLGF